MIHSVMVYFLAVVSLLLLIPALLISYLIPAPLKWRYAYVFASGWAKFILGVAGVRVVQQGAFDANRPVVYIGNHLSNMDVIIALAKFPVPMAFVSKIENKKIPMVRSWMKALGCVFIDRGQIRQQVKSLGIAQQRLKKGLSYTIFPEGTRSHDGSMGTFKAGAFKVATKTGIPVVPFALIGSDQIMKKGSLRIRPATVQLKLAPMIPTINVATNDLSDQTRAVIEKMMTRKEEATYETTY